MRKRLLAIVMSAAMVLTLVPSLAFATVNPADRDHEHTWSTTLQTINIDKDGKVITGSVAKRCDYTIYKAYTCACGEYKDAVQIGVAQHNYKKAAKSNCVETWDLYTCSKCGDAYKDNIKAIENGKHVLSSTRKVKSRATCTENEVRAYQCSTCKEYVDAVEVPDTKLGHKFNKPTTKADGTMDYTNASDTVAATCMTEGKYVYNCINNCGTTEEYTIPKLEHKYTVVAVVKEATCSSPQISAYCCATKGCPAYKSSFESAPAKAHTFGATVTTVATCEKEGLEVKTCTACGAKEEKTIPALTHKFAPIRTQVSPATCTEDEVLAYKCQNTGCKEYSDPISGDKALGHKKAEEITMWTYIAPSCTEKAYAAKICDRSNCEEVLATRELVDTDFEVQGIAAGKKLEPIGHIYKLKDVVDSTCAATGTRTYKCDCGETKVETIAKLPHTVVDIPAVAATYTKTGLTKGQKCSVCDETVLAQTTVAKKVLAKAKTPTVTAGKAYIKVKYSAVKDATGYQISYAKKGSKAKVITVKSSKAATKTIKKLTSKKTYTVKVRAYRTEGTKTVYGAYSTAKSIKVK